MAFRSEVPLDMAAAAEKLRTFDGGATEDCPVCEHLCCQIIWERRLSSNSKIACCIACLNTFLEIREWIGITETADQVANQSDCDLCIMRVNVIMHTNFTWSSLCTICIDRYRDWKGIDF